MTEPNQQLLGSREGASCHKYTRGRTCMLITLVASLQCFLSVSFYEGQLRNLNLLTDEVQGMQQPNLAQRELRGARTLDTKASGVSASPLNQTSSVAINENRTAGYYRYHNDTEVNHRTFFMLNASDPETPLFCKIAFGDLRWTARSSYDDLWADCTSKGDSVLLNAFTANDGRKKVTITHEVVKTGSTSVRLQIFQKLKKTCSTAEPKRPGYKHCDSIPTMTGSCSHIDAFMYGPKLPFDHPRPCFDYSAWEVDSSHQFIHTIAFREFYNWAKSAMNQGE